MTTSTRSVFAHGMFSDTSTLPVFTAGMFDVEIDSELPVAGEAPSLVSGVPFSVIRDEEERIERNAQYAYLLAILMADEEC